MDFSTILNYILGGTSLVTTYIAWATRKSAVETGEANALKSIRQVYKDLVEDTDQRLSEMRQEIADLKKELNDSKLRCKNCNR